MKFITLALVSLLVLSSVNVQAASKTPSFSATSNVISTWSSCIALISQTPCASSQNSNNCVNVLDAYTNCFDSCFSKSSFSDFNSCFQTCGTTATGSSSDSNVSSYVSAWNNCNSKLSGSLISLSTLLLFALALIF